MYLSLSAGTQTRMHTHTHTLKSQGRTVVSVKHWIWRWLFLINDLCAPPQSDRWALTLSTAALILLSSAVLSRTGRLAEWNKLIFSPPSYLSLWSFFLNLNFIHPLANNLALRQLVSGFWPSYKSSSSQNSWILQRTFVATSRLQVKFISEIFYDLKCIL